MSRTLERRVIGENPLLTDLFHRKKRHQTICLVENHGAIDEAQTIEKGAARVGVSNASL